MEVSSEERMKEGFGVSMTSGSSMRPLIWGGEHCVAVAPLDGEPVPGDILMFRYGSGSAARSIVHRLLAIQSPGEHDESSHVRSRPVATNAGSNNPRRPRFAADIAAEVATGRDRTCADICNAGNKYIMRGDNCDECEVISREAIIGRVTEIIRLGPWRPLHACPLRRLRTDSLPFRAYTRLLPLLRQLRRLRHLLSGNSHQ